MPYVLLVQHMLSHMPVFLFKQSTVHRSITVVIYEQLK